MTPTDQADRAAAKKWCDEFYPDSKQWRSEDGNAYQGFLAGKRHERQAHAAELQELVDACEALIGDYARAKSETESHRMRIVQLSHEKLIAVADVLAKHRARGGK